jgi:hypothetical protein
VAENMAKYSLTHSCNSILSLLHFELETGLQNEANLGFCGSCKDPARQACAFRLGANAKNIADCAIGSIFFPERESKMEIPVEFTY